MKTVGIITYHSALNYGSVTQALATQIVCDKLGYDSYLIDYRPKEQSQYYRLYRTYMGVKTFFADLSLLPDQKLRILREKKFAKFTNANLKLTEKQFTDPSEAVYFSNEFDVYVSGSDQILNKHSNELEHSAWEAMDPYLLAFTNKPKISYASSPANMSKEKKKKIIPKLDKFFAISAREKDSAIYLQNRLDRKVSEVLDPTLLLTCNEWSKYEETSSIIPERPYIFFYSLCGPRKGIGLVRHLIQIAKKMDMPIAVLMPYTHPFKSKYLINVAYAGPSDFLKLISDSYLVITDSFHGTVFSINYNKPFFSISNGKGSSTRKDQILHKLKLSDRIISSLESIDYSDLLIDKQKWDITNMILEELRRESMQYLSTSLQNALKE